MSAFHSVLSCICYVITAGTKNSKSSKDRGTHQKLTMISDTCNQCKVGKRALATL